MFVEWHAQLSNAIETTQQLERYINLSELEKHEIACTMATNILELRPITLHLWIERISNVQ